MTDRRSIELRRERRTVKATEILHDRGQSLWLDNITRSMLEDGVIQRHVDSYSVTGLRSNPSTFDRAIGSGDHDGAIRVKSGQGNSGEELFFQLAIEDLRRAADLFQPAHGDRHFAAGAIRIAPARRVHRQDPLRHA
jgi:transaldolase